MSRVAPFYGRLLIQMDIHTVTGLHIGGSEADFNIGGRDKLVIRDPITKKPYIPGSSLRGKMRSLLEKARRLKQNHRINKGFIHVCKVPADFQSCPVCSVFGIPAPSRPKDWGNIITLSRLVVRDTMLSEDSGGRLMAAHTDGLYTEFKTEVAIDRVTSAANPRTIERVPAGVIFADAELIFNVYEPADLDRIKVVLDALQLVEDDYLGGNGSRGY
ncbi:type III-A CRISPR-associated RAMP protein Csm3, partial [Candidatus Parcubacteria bacterium]